MWDADLGRLLHSGLALRPLMRQFWQSQPGNASGQCSRHSPLLFLWYLQQPVFELGSCDAREVLLQGKAA